LVRLAITLAIVGGIGIGATFLAQYCGWVQSTPSFLIPTTALLFIITLVICRYLYKFKSSGLFTQFYLLSMVVKLLASLAYCVVLILDEPKAAIPNVSYFLVLYLVYTSVEIVFLYRLVSAKSSS